MPNDSTPAIPLLARSLNRCADRFLHRVNLMVPGKNLVQPIAVGVLLERDEVADQLQEPGRIEHTPDQDLEFEHWDRRFAMVEGAPNLKPLFAGSEGP